MSRIHYIRLAIRRQFGSYTLRIRTPQLIVKCAISQLRGNLYAVGIRTQLLYTEMFLIPARRWFPLPVAKNHMLIHHEAIVYTLA